MFLLASLAFAQSTEPVELRDDVTVVYKKVTELDYEDVRVDATGHRPDGVLVLEPARPEFAPLIRLRTDFNTELGESVTAVR